MLLAAFLNLSGQGAVVVGGGAVAARRIPGLLRAGLRVTVIAPRIVPDVRALAAVCLERGYESGDVQGARLVLACTDDDAINDRVTADALALGLLVSHAGAAERGNLRFPAVIERGGVQVAVNTGRELPLLSQALGERLGAALPQSFPLERWAGERERAVALSGAEREAALGALRRDIRRHLELSA